MRRVIRLLSVVPRALGLLIGLAVFAVLAFLPFAGRFLDHDDPLQKADVIFVLAGARIERWLEAVDLYREGWAPRLVLSPGPVHPIEAQLRERGITYPREGELARQAVIAAGVPAGAVGVLPGGVDNTAHEAAELRRLLSANRAERLIVVTSRYHTRRAGYAFRRMLKDTGVQVIIRGSRYSEAHPSQWWRHRREARFILSETPKYFAYLAGLAE
jgi:uncharacterized SAM-binding protein YcdF (DUF218 family)